MSGEMKNDSIGETMALRLGSRKQRISSNAGEGSIGWRSARGGSWRGRKKSISRIGESGMRAKQPKESWRSVAKMAVINGIIDIQPAAIRRDNIRSHSAVTVAWNRGKLEAANLTMKSWSGVNDGIKWPSSMTLKIIKVSNEGIVNSLVACGNQCRGVSIANGSRQYWRGLANQ